MPSPKPGPSRASYNAASCTNEWEWEWEWNGMQWIAMGQSTLFSTGLGAPEDIMHIRFVSGPPKHLVTSRPRLPICLVKLLRGLFHYPQIDSASITRMTDHRVFSFSWWLSPGPHASLSMSKVPAADPACHCHGTDTCQSAVSRDKQAVCTESWARGKVSPNWFVSP